MQSDIEGFNKFRAWLEAESIVSSDELVVFLDELDGIDEVIADGLFISAVEEIGRGIARTRSLDVVKDMLSKNAAYLSQKSEFLYFFVESVVDYRLAMGDSFDDLISSLPEVHKPYISKRFMRRV